MQATRVAAAKQDGTHPSILFGHHPRRIHHASECSFFCFCFRRVHCTRGQHSPCRRDAIDRPGPIMAQHDRRQRQPQVPLTITSPCSLRPLRWPFRGLDCGLSFILASSPEDGLVAPSHARFDWLWSYRKWKDAFETELQNGSVEPPPGDLIAVRRSEKYPLM